MATRRHYQVWAELPENPSQELKDALINMGKILNSPVRIEGREAILKEGSKTDCYSFYNKNRRHSKVELHIGYVIPD